MEPLYLNVPYTEKDEAKALGARWDPVRGQWYVPVGSNVERFTRWRSPQDAALLQGPAPDYNIISSEAYLASTQTPCWKCGQETGVITIYCVEGRVDGQLERHFCASSATAVDEPLAEQLRLWPHFRLGFSRTAEASYWANHCERCDALQGNFYLHNEPGAAFFPMAAADFAALHFVPLKGQVRLQGSESCGPMEDAFRHWRACAVST